MTSNPAIPIFVVDAFSKQPFAGNGAAICLLDSEQVLSEDVMQKIAAEMNLSETAFVSFLNEGDTFETSKRFHLRWFTPTKEVPLCGHATLATAAVLFTELKNPSEKLEFETLSGTLVAVRSSDSCFSIDLPAYSSEPVDLKIYSSLIKAVCSLPVKEAVLSSSKKLLVRLQDDVTRPYAHFQFRRRFCPHHKNLLVRLQDHVTRQQLEDISPVASDLLSAASEGSSLLGVIVTVKGSGQMDCASVEGKPYDFVSRYFAPWLGIPEDPVTGSAHSVLGPYWANVLGRTELFAKQCSTRGGELKLTLQGDRIHIGGEAVIVLKGHFYL